MCLSFLFLPLSVQIFSRFSIVLCYFSTDLGGLPRWQQLLEQSAEGRRGVCVEDGGANKAWGGLAQGVSPSGRLAEKGDYWRLFSRIGFGRAALALC